MPDVQATAPFQQPMTSRVKPPSRLSGRAQQIADDSDEFRKTYAPQSVGQPDEQGASEDDMLPHATTVPLKGADGQTQQTPLKEGYIGIGPGSGAGSAAGDAQFESELASAPKMQSVQTPAHLMSDSELQTAIADARHAGDAARVQELQNEAITRTRDADESFATK